MTTTLRTEKPSPSTLASATSIPHTRKYHKGNGELGRWTQMVLSTRKNGCRLKNMAMRKKFSLVCLLSKFILLQCFTMDQYIAHKWEMEGRIRTFPSIWKGKDQVIHYLIRKTPNIFLFLAQNPMYVKCNGASCVYMGCITIDLHVSSI